MDVHNKKTRSYNMSRIKGRNTKPEILVRKYLFSKGFRYRINDNRYPGRPDIVLPKFKTCVFVNGCFWHMHEGCKHFVWPKNNDEFWRNKITKNAERDRKNYDLLRALGWHVIVIWECQLAKNVFEREMNGLIDDITSYKAK